MKSAKNKSLEALESERQIEDSNIQLKYRLYGHAPVQAEGTVRGQQLYFRARYDEWTFAVALSEEVDPAEIDFPEQGFFRQGQYGRPKKSEASYIPYDEAEAIIRRCSYEYVASEVK